MWAAWGPLSIERTGLTHTVIQNMALHKDLPAIVALDTFVGNADRSPPNLFYDASNDSFMGIDMGASFSSPLAMIAWQQLSAMDPEQFIPEEIIALSIYVNTLDFLVCNWLPKKQESLLLEYCRVAGFEEGSCLLDQNVYERIDFHRKCIYENYEHSVELVKMIRKILDCKQETRDK